MNKLSVLSWNLMGNTWYLADKLGVSGLSRKYTYKKIIKFLDSVSPEVLCFQEATKYFPELRNYLFNRGYALKFDHDKINNSNLIASKIPILNYGILAVEKQDDSFTHKIPRHVRSCVWVDCKLAETSVRIYNCQFRIRGVGMKERLECLNNVLQHAKSVNLPIIICGDMNTTLPSQGFARNIVKFVHAEPRSSMYIDGVYRTQDERYIFSALANDFGYVDALDIGCSTWALPYTSWELFSLKLDWFLVKDVRSTDYRLGEYITDHRSVLAKINLG